MRKMKVIVTDSGELKMQKCGAFFNKGNPNHQLCTRSI